MILKEKQNIKKLLNISCDKGEVFGEAALSGSTYSYENSFLSFRCDIENDRESGVSVRRDRIKNISENDITIYTLASVFPFDNFDASVYTQYNGWLNESTGGWSELVTGITLSDRSVRCCKGAAPYAVLWNRQSDRGHVFHFISDFAWEISITREPTDMQFASVLASFGMSKDTLALVLKPGEEISAGEILFYETKNKLDFDCQKIQKYFLDRYPRRVLPVIYNTWLAFFDLISFDKVFSQIKPASQLGCDYFVIDAGWFGKSEWYRNRGDWSESTERGLMGRMKELADAVRQNGMKFGLWIEAEYACPDSETLKMYPDDYIMGEEGAFLNFAKKEARDRMLGTIDGLIEKYGIELFKFDFNADLCYDPTHTAFNEYGKGYSLFVEELKRRHPDIYLENCASGGYRMSLRDGKLADCFWISDCQSAFYGTRIFKDTLKRLPVQLIERIASVTSCLSTAPSDLSQKKELLLTNEDQGWCNVRSLSAEYLKAFLTGGPLGFSCDLTKISSDVLEKLKKFISEYKEKSEFYRTCLCRILIDGEGILALEFFDEKKDFFRIVLFAEKGRAAAAVLHPYADRNSIYVLSDGREIPGNELEECGIRIPVPNPCCDAVFIDGKKKQ